MGGVTPYKLSFVLAMYSLLCMVVTTFLCVFIYTFFRIDAEYIPLLTVFPWYIMNYFFVSSILRKKEKVWKISLVNGDVYQVFQGGSLLKLYLGFVWRVMVLAILMGSILDKITYAQGDILLSAVLTGFILFFAYFWLFKFPLGSVRVEFNVFHTHVPYVLQGNPPEVVEINSALRSSDSIFSAVTTLIIGFGTGSLMLIYFLVGCIQLFAVFDFFREVWDWWLIPSFVAASFIAYIPVVGGLAGIYTAYTVWGWSLFLSVSLFCWPVILVGLVFVFVMFSEFFNWLRFKVRI